MDQMSRSSLNPHSTRLARGPLTPRLASLKFDEMDSGAMASPGDEQSDTSREHRKRVAGVYLAVAGFALTIVGITLYNYCTATFSFSAACAQWSYRAEGFGMFGLGIALFAFGVAMLYFGRGARAS